MLDERLLRQEHHDMDIYSAKEEGREEGKRQLVRAMLAEGLDRSTVCRIAQVTDIELDQLLSDDLSLG